MKTTFKRLEAKAVHGRFDLRLDFQEGINILHGKNGTGKTTLLHILANILNSDFQRFANLAFESVKAELMDGRIVQIQRDESSSNPYLIIQTSDADELRLSVTEILEKQRNSMRGISAQDYEEEPGPKPQELSAAYFPAFRNMIEAWVSMKGEAALHGRTSARGIRGHGIRRIRETRFARDLFGQFVPWVNYPSPLEIQERVAGEIQNATVQIAQTDRKLLSETFRDIFAGLSVEANIIEEEPENILNEIRSLSERLEQSSRQLIPNLASGVYTELRRLLPGVQLYREAGYIAVRILDVYRKSLREIVRVQENSVEIIKRYLESVNEFLDQKKLIITQDTTFDLPRVRISFDDGTTSPLRALSSGERQIVTLIYAATHMRSESVVLIDEPELSLHVDWQRLLLKKMAEQLLDRQIIACTHSPVIGADYLDRMKELELTPTQKVLPRDFEQEIQGDELEDA